MRKRLIITIRDIAGNKVLEAECEDLVCLFEMLIFFYRRRKLGFRKIEVEWI